MPASSKPDQPPSSTEPQGQDEARTRTIPVVQEELSLSRVTEKTGNAVRVRIEAHEEKQQVPVTEIVEELSIERVPVNRYVSERTAPREEGDAVVIPVFETVAVVEQRLLLKEEVRIVRHRREIRREEEVVLRKETAIVERKTANQDEWSQDSQDP